MKKQWMLKNEYLGVSLAIWIWAVAIIGLMIMFIILVPKKLPINDEYEIKESIKPYEFIDGLGSKYYVEVFKSGEVILSLSEGINFITPERKEEMLIKAKEYIKKCKELNQENK